MRIAASLGGFVARVAQDYALGQLDARMADRCGTNMAQGLQHQRAAVATTWEQLCGPPLLQSGVAPRTTLSL